MSQIPSDADGNSVVDIYVRLPTADKYVCWVKKGDPFPTKKREKLLDHPDPRLYCPIDDWQNRHKFLGPIDTSGKKLGEDAKDIVTDLFLNLLDDNGDHENASEQLANISKVIVNEIVEDLAAYEKKVLAELEDISRLEDSYAIRSLCIIFSLALGFDSKTALIDITTSVMFMDVALLDFTQQEIDMYYEDPSAMSVSFAAAYEKHPAKAHYIASQKLKRFSEQGLLMILNHHELNNGQGFPRKSQTRPLPDLIKILSYAVDVFERLKRSDLRKEKLSLKEALIECYEIDAEAHMRRHQTGMMDKVLKYLGVTKPRTS